MSEQDKKAEKPALDDQELSDLLDSALQDFSKEPPKEESKPEEKSATCEDPAVGLLNPQAQEWSDDFIQQAAGQFEANFAKLLAGANPNEEVTPDLIQQKLQQMADAAQTVLTNPTEVSDASVDFASTIKEAIQNLNTGAEPSQNAAFGEEDLMRMFGSQQADLMPFMQGMMQGLLSKEVLGPSLQDFVEKLPPYLEKNKDTLSEEDVTRYTNQKTIMEQVLEELNKENDSDSLEVKKERFNKVLGLMQKLQDYGQPPTELVGDVEAPFNFDPAGNPAGMPNLDPSANPECCVM